MAEILAGVFLGAVAFAVIALLAHITSLIVKGCRENY